MYSEIMDPILQYLIIETAKFGGLLVLLTLIELRLSKYIKKYQLIIIIVLVLMLPQFDYKHQYCENQLSRCTYLVSQSKIDVQIIAYYNHVLL
ncbi:unnamed protein product [Paramecium sonneborni]|uniref:Uncharacterized protein n=1 Tax=Paramecium sonneborni TaxID=65129 RepID=A0A8S1RKP2_9CILI|nr:unnamed protein product [Paramecium sonneborni]